MLLALLILFWIWYLKFNCESIDNIPRSLMQLTFYILCLLSLICDSNNWSGDFEGSTVLTYPKSTFCSYTIAQRCTLPWSGVPLGFCLHSTSSYPGSQRGQTDKVCCKRLVTGNDNYTYLRTKPRWTTLQTCCRQFLRSLKVMWPYQHEKRLLRWLTNMGLFTPTK